MDMKHVPIQVKQQLPLWLVGKEVKEVEADKQEVRAWLDILGSSSANPPSEEKVVWLARRVLTDHSAFLLRESKTRFGEGGQPGE